MPNKKYIVDLTEAEREQLQQLTRRGKLAARTVTRARILLHAAAGCTDQQIAAALSTSLATVERVRQRFVEEGLESALQERARRGATPKLGGKEEAHLIAVACSQPPLGRARWSLRLLADKAVELGLCDSISHEAVRQTLKKTSLNRGKSSSGVFLKSVPSS
jgi:transposase